MPSPPYSWSFSLPPVIVSCRRRQRENPRRHRPRWCRCHRSLDVIAAAVAGQKLSLLRPTMVSNPEPPVRSLDVDQRVASGVATGEDVGGEIEGEGRSLGSIARGVETGSAIECVRSRAADQGVVAVEAAQHVDAAVSRERIVLRVAVQRERRRANDDAPLDISRKSVARRRPEADPG